MREVLTKKNSKIILGSLLTSVIFGMAVGCSQNSTPTTSENDQARIKEKVIYGQDNRLDIYQVNNSTVVALANSTAAIFDKGNVISNGNGTSRLKTENYKKAYDLCDGEAFADQPIGAFCSGFLVADDILVTAGHCIKRSYECTGARFVFGYEVTAPGAVTTTIANENIYSCKEIIKTTVAQNGADYAVIKLDRKVTNRRPLDIRRSGVASVGDPLFVVGYPVGLPKKVAGGANIRKVASDYYVANLDSYGGNSGSAVFNGVTGEVEGILVRGETDFVSQGSCNVSYKCSDNGCRGEDVTKISHIIPYVPVTTQPEEPVVIEDITYSANVNVVIPDNQAIGITSQINATEAPKGRTVTVTLDLEHTWTGDLVVTLTSPEGEIITLHNRQGGSTDNIKGTYGVNLTSYQSLNSLAQEKADGIWALKVSDNAYWDRGVLRGWKLHFNK